MPRCLLGTSAFLLLMLIKKEGSVYALQAEKLFEEVAAEHNNDGLLIPSATCYKALLKLEAKGYIFSWDERSDGTRGMPQKHYCLTIEGNKHLEGFLRAIKSLGG